MTLPPAEYTSNGWNSRKAWLAVAALFFSQLCLATIILLATLVFKISTFVHSPVGTFIINIASGLLAVAITILFSQIKSIQEFSVRFGLGRPPVSDVLKAVFAGGSIALGLRMLMKLGVAAPRNTLVQNFTTNDSQEMFYLSLLMLGGPFIEEIIMRGYIYKAFRQNYSVLISICIVCAISFVTHCGVVTSALAGAMSIGILNITLCVCREKTRHLWSSIACHFAYNLVFLL